MRSPSATACRPHRVAIFISSICLLLVVINLPDAFSILNGAASTVSLFTRVTSSRIAPHRSSHPTSDRLPFSQPVSSLATRHSQHPVGNGISMAGSETATAINIVEGTFARSEASRNIREPTPQVGRIASDTDPAVWSSALLLVGACVLWQGRQGQQQRAAPVDERWLMTSTNAIRFMDADPEPPDKAVPPEQGVQTQLPLLALLDRWKVYLPGLSPEYEDRLYIRQRRVNSEIDPGSYTWIRLRHLAVLLVALLVSHSVLNFSLYHIMCWVHQSFELGVLQQRHLQAGFQKAITLVRYQQIMGRLPEFSGDEFLLHVKALSAQFEAEENIRMVQVIVNRLSDAVFFSALAGFLFSLGSKVKKLWNQVRLIIRLNFRTPFRAVVLLFLSDVMLGFHSNELWVLFLTYLGERYGIEVRNDNWINVIKAIIPVAVDVCFKFTVFYYMQTKTKVIMREMSEY